jgi:peptidoglycan/LPS O-acetylase OafA/YrhL
MDKLRIAVALVLVGAYLASMVAAVLNPSYSYPPGLAVGFALAVSFLLGGPAIDRIRNFRVDIKSKEDEDES